MMTIMLRLYLLSIYDKIPTYSMRSHFIINSLMSTIRLIIICLGNGKLYDEADQLLFALEDLNYSKLKSDENAFRELITFRTLNWHLPHGFTIGGLMPLKRTTLLSVFKMCFLLKQARNTHF